MPRSPVNLLLDECCSLFGHIVWKKHQEREKEFQLPLSSDEVLQLLARGHPTVWVDGRQVNDSIVGRERHLVHKVPDDGSKDADSDSETRSYCGNFRRKSLIELRG